MILGISYRSQIEVAKKIRQNFDLQLSQLFIVSRVNFAQEIQLQLGWQIDKYKYQERQRKKKKNYCSRYYFSTTSNIKAGKNVPKDANLNNKTLQVLKYFLCFSNNIFKYLKACVC